jgi:hypothetical protein
MLLGPNKFHKMAKVCHKKKSQFCVCVCVCDNNWRFESVFYFLKCFAVQLSNHVIWVPWFLMILVELVRFFTLLISVAPEANYVAPTKSGPQQIIMLL